MATYPASAREAWLRLRALAEDLSHSESRPRALSELRELAELARGRPEGSPLRLTSVVVAVGAAQERLELLLLPSIFAPEAWAYTFVEGLLSVPLEEYAGKRLVEVGCGSGWVCIALARFTRLAHIQGLDLNPHAVAVALCNAWLNGDEALVSRLSFSESDLLRAVPAEPRWDFVVGCIPQVLRSEGLPTELSQADESALYELSNYCALQNVYEDHFGLGLIARLLDEAPERLSAGGRLLLNLGGRPGREIIARMFTRRGYTTRVRVARRVQQAADTDIRPLVALEQRTGRSFEFFMGAHSPEPLCAATALGWLTAGHPVWHEVAVWEARPALPQELLALRTALRGLGAPRLQEELDLGSASSEQLGFTAALAERLAASPTLPYAHTAGDVGFRQWVARYLGRFFGLHLLPEELFVAPERERALYALLLATCDEGDTVLVSRSLQPVYARVLEQAGVRATLTHNTLGEIRQLLGAFAPKLVLLSVEPQERANLAELREIVSEAARRGILVVVDESPFFHITDEVEPRTLFELLAREPSLTNLVVLCGLIKNAVLPDLELTLLLPVPSSLRHDLEAVAVGSYSHISTLAQWFYERTFAELLTIRVAFSEELPPPVREAPEVPLPRSGRAGRLAALQPSAPEQGPGARSEAPVPRELLEGLVAACAAPRESTGHGLHEAVAALLWEAYGVRYSPQQVVSGPGVRPLMHHLGLALRRRLGRAPRVFVATPCAQPLQPTWVAAGCEVELGPLPAVQARQGGSAPDVVVLSLSGETSAPLLSLEELARLAAWVVEQRCLLVWEDVFGLAELKGPAARVVPSPVALEAAVRGIGAHTVVLGGLSQEFAAGGLGVGWMVVRDEGLAAAVRESRPGVVPLAAARAATRWYAACARSLEERRLSLRRHEANAA